MSTFAIFTLVSVLAATQACHMQEYCSIVNVASWQYAYAEKTVPEIKWITSMTPSKQQSAAQCTQGTSYGFAKDLMWVDKGCRADFQVCYLAGNCWKTNVSSWKYKFFTQVLEGVSCIYSMKVVKQISAAGCQIGSTFGFIANNVWVDKGCRADFEICYL